MTEEHSLLAAIRANPDDDYARLRFADWLDDHDRPERAEMIREQCRDGLSRVTKPYELIPGLALYATRRRGFLSKVRLSWEDWKAHGDAILDDPCTPGLDEVVLTTNPDISFRVFEDGYTSLSMVTVAGRDIELGAISATDDVLNARWNYGGKPAVRSWKLPEAELLDATNFNDPPQFLYTGSPTPR